MTVPRSHRSRSDTAAKSPPRNRKAPFRNRNGAFATVFPKILVFLPKNKKSFPLLTPHAYQQHAPETAIYPDDRRIIYPTLGLTGEAGEVADKVKKVIRDAHEEFTPERRLEIVKEIGDVLWYCATLSRDLGYELEEVAQMNVDKLRSRMQRHLISGNGDNR